MRIWKGARWAVFALGMAVGVAAAPAAGPLLLAVSRIEPGQWQIKTVGSDDAPRVLCVGNPMMFVHYKDRGRGCGHTVVVNESNTATIQYRCGDAASGRATVHVATPRAFDLDMQGLEGGLPYEDSYEAHRIGDCTPPHSERR